MRTVRTHARALAFVICSAAALFGTTGAGAGTQPDGAPGTAHDASTILVKFTSPAVAQNLIAAHGDRHLGTTATGVHVVKLRPGAVVATEVRSYGTSRGVLYAEPNYIARTSLAAPNDPDYATDWGMEKIRAVDGWTAYPGSYSSEGGVPLAVIDTGVQSTHPDLSGRIQTSSGADCTGSTNSCVAGAAADDNGHGTHVAGIAGAATNNGVGVAGVAFSSPIVPVKVLNSSGTGTYASIANGIIWAVQKGAKVVNLSLGGDAYSQTLCDAVTTALNNGVLIVASAGNSGSSDPSYPAACPGALGVAATDSSDGSPSYSNFGSPNVFVSAPGSSIYSTYSNSSYRTLSGTSMAAPFVAGLAALLRSQIPSRTIADVKRLLATTSDKVGGLTYGSDPYATCAGCTWNQDFGYGRINSASALSVAAPPTSGSPITAAVVASADDGYVGVTGSVYPPSGAGVPNTSAALVTAGRRWHSGFELYTGLVRFDTSSIPDSATVTGATLRLYVAGKADGDNRSLVGEWYSAANWPIDGADAAVNLSGSALSGADLTQIATGASNDFALTGLSSISKTGFTGLRLGISGGQPAADNYLVFAAWDHATLPEAKLIVTYTTAPPPPTTVTLSPPASADDGYVGVTGSVYPPSGAGVPNTSAALVTAGRRWHSGFELYTGLVRFDTSSIPDSATVTGATLRLYVAGKADGDNRSLVGEWYSAANWPIDGADAAVNLSGSALAGADLTQIATGASNDFALTGLSSISKTGFTGLRLGISGGQPAADNYLVFAAWDHATLPEAKLIVTYTT